MDYAYKIALKKAILHLAKHEIIDLNNIDNIRCYVDEHTTATNGRYELQQALEHEFKIGTFNSNYQIFYEPVIPRLKSAQVQFCDSSFTLLVRSADIVANRIYYLINSDQESKLARIKNMYITKLP